MKTTPQIDLNEVASEYNKTLEIWPKSDRWHWSTKRIIEKFIKLHLSHASTLEFETLNAGSGGNNYGLKKVKMVHVDVADKLINKFEKYIVCNIETIPLPPSSFQQIICVGSVINYTDPALVINEFSRVLKEDGIIVLEFENSKSLELSFTNKLNKPAILVETFYKNAKIHLWYFSEEYIQSICESNSLKVISIKRFHIISPLIFRLTKNVNFSAKFIFLDYIARLVPILNKYSSNIILLLQKKST